MGDDLSFLRGARAHVLPYDAEHGYPEGALLVLWQRCKDADVLHRIMPTPGEVGGHTIEKFCGMLNDKPVFLVFSNAPDELIGFGWYSMMDAAPHKAHGNICYFANGIGEAAVEGTCICVEYGFRILGLRAVWATTFWKAAARHVMKAGFKYIASLPRYGQVNGKPMDVHVLVKESPYD